MCRKRYILLKIKSKQFAFTVSVETALVQQIYVVRFIMYYYSKHGSNEHDMLHMSHFFSFFIKQVAYLRVLLDKSFCSSGC